MNSTCIATESSVRSKMRDAVQETLLSAWQGLASFEGRAALRTWLYRVAANRSLDALRAEARRPAVTTIVGGVEPPQPTRISEVGWLQPYPDLLLDDLPDDTPGPDAVVATREAISLAFITALQLLPPRQRAVLILRDVLGYRASEVAYILDTTEESVTSALKRARATLRGNLEHRDQLEAAPAAGSPTERRTVEQFVEAFVAHDVPGIVALLSEAAWVKMPPMPFDIKGERRPTLLHRSLSAERTNPTRGAQPRQWSAGLRRLRRRPDRGGVAISGHHRADPHR